eukprot:412870_1
MPNFIVCLLITSIVVLLSLIVNTSVFISLYKNKNTQSSLSTKLAILLCITFSYLSDVDAVIWFSLYSSINITEIKTFNLFQICYFISLGYFLKTKYESFSQHQFFALNQLCLNIFFVTFIVFNTASAAYDVCLAHINKIIAIEFVWISILLIYTLLILILYTRNLRKYLSFTMTSKLSSQFTVRFIFYIIQQINLVFIIAIITLFYGVLFLLSNIFLTFWFIEIWLFIFFKTAIIICLYLTFNFNQKYYLSMCKYGHLLCNSMCGKVPNKQQPLLNVNNDSYNVDQIVIIHNHDCNNHDVAHCRSVQSICKILKLYDNSNTNNISELFNKINYSFGSLLNDFSHLLSFHDSEEEFDRIHQLLNQNTMHMLYGDCKIYMRHSRRRYMSITEEKHQFNHDDTFTNDKDTIQYILDKLHAYYYHSYDTLLRYKWQSNTLDQNKQIMNLHKLMKIQSQKDNFINNNKFSSNLNLEKNSNNIYSFGQRFEYDIDEKNEWLITPIYDGIKQELIDNKICSISFNIYNIEYSKCIHYSKSDHVKSLKNRIQNEELIINHILSLLIYCNCDQYQNKWSSTFRRIPNNENCISLKTRHSHFYYCSKYLRALVEYFGEQFVDKHNRDKTLYHGVSEVLYFERTITQFHGPLSTSEQINVALRFSGHIGIILALKYSFSTYPLNAKYFSCSYFSDYVNEKECLLIGGMPMMIIINIININNGEIYKRYINALNII